MLEREYIFDSGSPPISITGLAEKHGLARSGVAEKAIAGRWFERRNEFREQLGEKMVSALADEWVEYETGVREKLMQVGLKYLDKFTADLDEGKIKVNTRDMLGIAGMIRTLLLDTHQNPKPEEALIDPTSVTFSVQRAQEILDEIKRYEDGSLDGDGPQEPDEQGPAGLLEATSSAGPRQN